VVGAAQPRRELLAPTATGKRACQEATSMPTLGHGHPKRGTDLPRDSPLFIGRLELAGANVLHLPHF